MAMTLKRPASTKILDFIDLHIVSRNRFLSFFLMEAVHFLNHSVEWYIRIFFQQHMQSFRLAHKACTVYRKDKNSRVNPHLPSIRNIVSKRLYLYGVQVSWLTDDALALCKLYLLLHLNNTAFPQLTFFLCITYCAFCGS